MASRLNGAPSATISATRNLSEAESGGTRSADPIGDIGSHGRRTAGSRLGRAGRRHSATMLGS